MNNVEIKKIKDSIVAIKKQLSNIEGLLNEPTAEGTEASAGAPDSQLELAKLFTNNLGKFEGMVVTASLLNCTKAGYKDALKNFFGVFFDVKFENSDVVLKLFFGGNNKELKPLVFFYDLLSKDNNLGFKGDPLGILGNFAINTPIKVNDMVDWRLIYKSILWFSNLGKKSKNKVNITNKVVSHISTHLLSLYSIHEELAKVIAKGLKLKVEAVEAVATESTELPATELPATELPATELPATELPATEIEFDIQYNKIKDYLTGLEPDESKLFLQFFSCKTEEQLLSTLNTIEDTKKIIKVMP